ncbi:hypothetical protein ARTHRO9AX_210086 [Arthrobacter sp. 9AX]|nr:hypothetical protein ARTHRO9AX_210086 [Arthrobacter sp. 9AX]
MFASGVHLPGRGARPAGVGPVRRLNLIFPSTTENHCNLSTYAAAGLTARGPAGKSQNQPAILPAHRKEPPHVHQPGPPLRRRNRSARSSPAKHQTAHRSGPTRPRTPGREHPAAAECGGALPWSNSAAAYRHAEPAGI